MAFDFIDFLGVVVSRQEVQSGDTSVPLGTLKGLLSSAAQMRNFCTRVDIAFDGFNDTSHELFEIDEVREYVHALDAEFPYWLFFLSRHALGLQCLSLCFLPPFLTDEGRAEIHPQRLAALIDRRWGPALFHACSACGMDEAKADALLDSALGYFKDGPIRPTE